MGKQMYCKMFNIALSSDLCWLENNSSHMWWNVQKYTTIRTQNTHLPPPRFSFFFFFFEAKNLIFLLKFQVLPRIYHGGLRFWIHTSEALYPKGLSAYYNPFCEWMQIVSFIPFQQIIIFFNTETYKMSPFFFCTQGDILYEFCMILWYTVYLICTLVFLWLLFYHLVVMDTIYYFDSLQDSWCQSWTPGRL